MRTETCECWVRDIYRWQYQVSQRRVDSIRASGVALRVVLRLAVRESVDVAVLAPPPSNNGGDLASKETVIVTSCTAASNAAAYEVGHGDLDVMLVLSCEASSRTCSCQAIER
jgi:hypothetical protein